jgi:putative tricarboxylic transport membrane protein
MDTILQGISLATTPAALLAIIVGLIAGQILGAVPGLTASMAVALLVPYTFYLDPWIGIPMLLGMFKGSLFGSSVTAILVNTPGAPAAAATVLDGYPLAKKGKGVKAMKMALYASVFGDSFSDICLIVAAGALATVALKFGPPEYTLLTGFSMVTISALAGPSLWRGLFAVALGMTIGMIGLDPIAATPRMTFGYAELEEGIGLIPMLIGILAVSEALRQMEQPVHMLANRAISFSTDRADNRVSMAEFKEILPTLIKSSGMGTMIGAMPGLGATIAAFLAYGEAKRSSKKPEEFGKGSLEGVAAAEAANNAVSGSNMIPLLAFGIPGDVSAALIMGAFLIQGITLGPVVFQDNPVEIYAIYAAMLVANIFNLFLGQGLILMARRVVGVPKRLLFPTVLVIASAGAYALRGSIFDIQLVFLFGVIGYLMTKLRIPTVPMLIGFILMPILEENLRITLLLSSSHDLNIAFVLQRPAFLALLAIMGAAVYLILKRRRALSTVAPASADEE